MSGKSCSTCAHAMVGISRYTTDSWLECGLSKVRDAIHVKVADDHGLDVSFRPPEGFSCSFYSPTALEP